MGYLPGESVGISGGMGINPVASDAGIGLALTTALPCRPQPGIDVGRSTVTDDYAAEVFVALIEKRFALIGRDGRRNLEYGALSSLIPSVAELPARRVICRREILGVDCVKLLL